MPATSIRDLVIKDDDLVVGTHGRGFWILDGISTLREWQPAVLQEEAHLFKPGDAIRFEWNRWPDTPLPPDEPSSPNPPDGAVIEYHLKQPASGVVTLEILDRAGATIRRFASDDKAREIRDEGNVPSYWIRPSRILSAAPGLHRFVWDLHYPPPAGSTANYPISATPRDTEPEPKGPFVVPGAYSVKLTVNGKPYTQPLIVKMDPRVKQPADALQQQFDLSKRVYDAINTIQATLPKLQQARERAQAAGNTDLAQQLQTLAGATGGRGRGGGGGRGRGGAPGAPSLASIAGQLSGLYGATQDGSAPPPSQTREAIDAALKDYDALMAQITPLIR